MNTIDILIVDDHPLTCQGYAVIINNGIEEGKLPKINIDEAYNGKDAYKKLVVAKPNTAKIPPPTMPPIPMEIASFKLILSAILMCLSVFNEFWSQSLKIQFLS